MYTSADPFPEDEGGTLFATDFGAATVGARSNYVRAGLIWDTRDRESSPGRGAWSEILVQQVAGVLGADETYTRWTVTDRRYVSLVPRLVFAHRWLLQGVGTGASVPDLFRVQTSFKQQEGLGGAKRAADFAWGERNFHVVLSGFLDQGRVWAGGPRLGETFSDLHRGYGGGVRLGMGENFVVAFDAGTSSDGGLPFYTGLGYLF